MSCCLRDLSPGLLLILVCQFFEVARRQARKAFLALSQDEGSEIACSKPDEEDSGNVPHLPADDDNQFTKSTPVRLCPCLSNK